MVGKVGFAGVIRFAGFIEVMRLGLQGRFVGFTGLTGEGI